MRRKRRKQDTRSSNNGKIILVRLVILTCLVGVGLFLSGFLLRSMIGTRVLGDRTYLTHYDDSGDEGSGKNDIRVICFGPEEKKFETTLSECKRKSEQYGFPLRYEMREPPSPIFSQEAHRDEAPEEIFRPEPEHNEEILEPQAPQNEPHDEEREHEDDILQMPIEVETKDKTETINIAAKGIKIHLAQNDEGKLVVKAEQEDGTEVELSDDALFHIEDRLAVDHIKIATTSANEFLIQRNHTAALTNFPLSWDLSTNTLIVTTPAGKREVTILPDQAIQNLVASQELSEITLPNRVKTDKTVDLGAILDIATLTHKNGEPVYQITGITSQKLFGLFPVAIEKTVNVAGDTGKVVDSSETPVNTFVDLVSF